MNTYLDACFRDWQVQQLDPDLDHHALAEDAVMTRGFVAALLALTVALVPEVASAQSTDNRDATFEEVQSALTDAGYTVGTATWWTPAWWTPLALAFRVASNLDEQQSNLWVFVYPTSAAAREAHRIATLQAAARLNHPLPYSDERGPQLLTGFGASYWWRNIATVQQAEPGDANAWPVAPSYPIVVVGSSSTTDTSATVDGMPLTGVDQHFMDVLESAIS